MKSVSGFIAVLLFPALLVLIGFATVFQILDTKDYNGRAGKIYVRKFWKSKKIDSNID